MDQDWTVVLDLAYLSILLGVASVLKRILTPLSKILIPNAVIAGFLGILFGPEVLKLIPFSYDRLGNLVYHLMAVGFIAIALKKTRRSTAKSSVNTGFLISISYALQGFVGFIIGIALVGLFFKDLFPPFGLLLALGFAQGPGQAYSLGSKWEALGFTGGGAVGLSVATLGFLWSAFGGIVMLNTMVYRKKQIGIQIERPTVRKRIEATIRDFEFSDIDGFTIQILAVGIVYLATYLFLKWFTSLIGGLGTFGETFAQVLWGFHFVIGVLFAMAFRAIYERSRKSEKYEIEYMNDFLLQRIGGGVFDFMVAASIAGISFSVIQHYIWPIIILTTIGGFFIAGYSIWFGKRIYEKAPLEHIVTFFGMHTGTLSTGMALLREVDPTFETGTAEDMVFGSGLALFLGIPMLVLLNIPILGYREGKPIYYLYFLLGLAAYILALYFFWFRKARIRKREKAN